MVGIIMGSLSDRKVMQEAADALKELGITFEMEIVSAHRTPERMMEYGASARARGLKVIIGRFDFSTGRTFLFFGNSSSIANRQFYFLWLYYYKVMVFTLRK